MILLKIGHGTKAIPSRLKVYKANYRGNKEEMHRKRLLRVLKFLSRFKTSKRETFINQFSLKCPSRPQIYHSNRISLSPGFKTIKTRKLFLLRPLKYRRSWFLQVIPRHRHQHPWIQLRDQVYSSRPINYSHEELIQATDMQLSKRIRLLVSSLHQP